MGAERSEFKKVDEALLPYLGETENQRQMGVPSSIQGNKMSPILIG